MQHRGRGGHLGGVVDLGVVKPHHDHRERFLDLRPRQGEPLSCLADGGFDAWP
jgi:hypothetical protein